MQKRRKLNKKGSVQDLILIAVVLFAFAVTTLFAFKIINEFNTGIQAQAAIPQVAVDSTTQLAGYFPAVLDKSMMFIVIVMSIGTLVLAALVRIHPMFMALFFIALVFIIFLCGILSNIYEEIAANSLLVTEAAQLTNIARVMDTLPFVIGIIGILLMIVQYKVWRADF